MIDFIISINITVNDLMRLWPDEVMEGLNYSRVILVFDEYYTKEEHDKIYNWFKNVIKCNHLHELNKYDNENGKYILKESYDDHHEFINKVVCYIENCDLQVIRCAYDLYDMISDMDGYDIYYIRSEQEEQ